MKKEEEEEDKNKEQKNQLIPGITGHCAVNYGKFIIVFGGRSSTFYRYIPTILFIYDTEINVWSHLNPINNLFEEEVQMGDFHSACVINDREMIVYGPILERESEHYGTVILRFPDQHEDKVFDWIQPTISGVIPIGGKHRHLINVKSEKIFLMGGKYDFEESSIRAIHYFETFKEENCCNII